MKLVKNYVNGNYEVLMFDNGTKVRMLHKGETDFDATFPENIDCCISKKCSVGCKYCYANCTSNGSQFDITNPKVLEFLRQLRPGMEIAIGGGALSEVDPLKFKLLLQDFYTNGVIANITLNSKELLNKDWTEEFLYHKFMVPNFIHGIGVSYNSNEECKKEMLRLRKRYPENVVVHTIVGITTPEDYLWLAENRFKVLVLGYKMKGRGSIFAPICYKEELKIWVENNILSLRKKFKSLSFDCLAVEQLNIEQKVDKDTWETFYMGDDGKFTMYVDLVDCTFSKSSTEKEYHHFGFAGDNIKTMFKIIKNKE